MGLANATSQLDEKAWQLQRVATYKFGSEQTRRHIFAVTSSKIRNSPLVDTNFAQSPFSIQLWGTKLSKHCQNVLDLVVGEDIFYFYHSF